MPRPAKKTAKEKERDAQPQRKYKSYAKLRGMRDVLFDEYKYWDLVINKAVDLSRTYGFKRIETPAVESL